MTYREQPKVFEPAKKAPQHLLRLIVIALACLQLFAAGYVLYALFLDDTTSWVMSELLALADSEDLWKAVVYPLAAAGVAAILLANVNRMLLLALGIVIAGPIVTTCLLI